MDKTLGSQLTKYREQLQERLAAIDMLLETEDIQPELPFKAEAVHQAKRRGITRNVTHRNGHRTSVTKARDWFAKNPGIKVDPAKMSQIINMGKSSGQYALLQLHKSGYIKRVAPGVYVR